jgi:hypothetical protein
MMGDGLLANFRLFLCECVVSFAMCLGILEATCKALLYLWDSIAVQKQLGREGHLSECKTAQNVQTTPGGNT